jgi:hypothetical protein
MGEDVLAELQDAEIAYELREPDLVVDDKESLSLSDRPANSLALQ